MKEITIEFTDAEFRKLKKAKRLSPYQNWAKFIIHNCTKGVSEKRNGNKN